MKQHVASTLKLCITIIFFLFLKQSFCLNSTSYEVCDPKPCGHDGTSINFPFFTLGPQGSLCGYPGFEVQCHGNGSLVLPISGNDYLVKDIHYNNSSMRLVTAQNITCPLALTNITLDPYRFRLYNDSATRELVFLMNCSKELPENLRRYKIGSCGRDILLVMLSDDRNLGMGKEVCAHLVVATVHVYYNAEMEVVDGGNYVEVMMKGFMMQWIAPYCSECKDSGGRCGSNGYDLQCYCPFGDQIHARSCPNPFKKFGESNMLLVVALGIGLASLVIILIKKVKWSRKTNVNVENFLKNHEFLDPKRYTYSQIRKMTNSFEVKLGQGGFGSVYKGVLSNGNLVAVKVLSESKGNGEDFVNEVASVGKTCHINIVSLVGFCSEGRQRALIYEFMANGSLERFIYDQTSSNSNQLGWEKLFQIAIGIARGLEYLHSGCSTRILHFDIKPHNILLDKDFCPKISDFGLAKLFPAERSMISMSRMRGTPGYIAPELLSMNFCHASHKSDVYSYGMMILEMVGGRKNIEVDVDHTSEIYFPYWIYKKVELRDEKLELHGIVSGEENEMAMKMIIVGLWCIQTNPLCRPAITKVLEMLEGDLESMETPPKPFLSSPSSDHVVLKHTEEDCDLNL